MRPLQAKLSHLHPFNFLDIPVQAGYRSGKQFISADHNINPPQFVEISTFDTIPSACCFVNIIDFINFFQHSQLFTEDARHFALPLPKITCQQQLQVI
jgi:hypothetical protein